VIQFLNTRDQNNCLSNMIILSGLLITKFSNPILNDISIALT